MSSVDFVSRHAAASLHGNEGHYLRYLPCAMAIGLLEPHGYEARKKFLGIIAPEAGLRQVNEAGFARYFPSAWMTGIGEEFAWRGHRLDPFHISLNTALAAGSDPVRLACRFAARGYPYVEGPHRAWLAAIIDEGLETGVFRGPDQGWVEVAALLRERADEPVIVTSSADGTEFPNPYLGGWFPGELGNDYTKLTEEQIEPWETRQLEWDESEDEPMKWAIALPALRASRNGLEMRPDSWRELYFGKRITVFDLLASDRDARLEAVFGHTTVTVGSGE